MRNLDPEVISILELRNANRRYRMDIDNMRDTLDAILSVVEFDPHPQAETIKFMANTALARLQCKRRKGRMYDN